MDRDRAGARGRTTKETDVSDDSIEFHRTGEWTAVYLNGKLERVGDHYLADEWLQGYVGVEVVSDDAFMCGGESRQDVAETLEGVAVYREWRDRRLSEAEDLEEQARQLRDKAAQLKAALRQGEDR
jgi:hypothetical protein